MKSIIKHILINIYEKKLRTAIIILTILLSTMVLFFGLSLNQIINDAYTTMVKGAYGDANIIMTKDSDDGNPFYDRSEINTEYIRIEQSIDIINATGKSFISDENVSVSLAGADLNKAFEMELVAPIRTVDNFSMQDNMAMISQKTATDYGLDLGDILEVSVNDNTYHYMVAAISETNGIYYSEMDTILLLVSADQLNNVFETEDQFTSTLMKIADEDLDTAITTLAENHLAFSVQKTSSALENRRDEETFQISMIAAIIIIVMISAYVILSLSKVIVSERMPVVGTFRSVGASKRMMNGILYVEFLIYGLIGAVIGIILAIVLLPPIADIFNEYKEFGVNTNVNYQIGYLAIAFVFGVFFPVCVAFIHILGMNRFPLKESLLNTSQTVRKQSIWPVMIGAFLFGSAFVLYFINRTDKLSLGLISVLFLFIAIVLLIPAFLNLISRGGGALVKRIGNGEIGLGIKNIANNKTVANNCSMIIIVFILLMMVGTAANGIDDFVSHTIRKDFDVLVTDLAEEPSYYDKDIEMIDGVSNLDIQYISVANFQIKDSMNEFGVIGVEDVEAFDTFNSAIHFNGSSTQHLKAMANGVVVDEYQAKRHKLNLGDKIQLQPLDENFHPVHDKDSYIEAVIAGTMDSSASNTNRETVIVNLDYFNDHFKNAAHYNISLKVDEGANVEQVKKEISELYVDSRMTVLTFEEMLASQTGTIDTLITGITIIILLGMVIGLLGITNNLIVSFIQRKQEYAILYSVCMSRVQLIKMLFVEMVMTWLAVVVIGLIGGFSMYIVMIKLLYGIGLRIQFSFDFQLFGILCGVVFVILALSSLSTIRRVKKMNMLKELRYE